MKLPTLLALSLQLAAVLSAAAQSHVVAYVPTTETESVNALGTSGNLSLLGGDTVIHAMDDRPAHITLARGGAILVCQSSKVHLTEAERISFQGEKSNLIGLALESGALEIRMPISVGDTLVTPDLRFTSGHFKPANLDLAMGLSPNGDTCVENRGKDAPWLNITDSSGNASYRLRPKQHILFEQASLKDVVDIDNNTCGCPSLLPPTMTLADALLNGSPGAATKPPAPPVDTAALAFPTDESRGYISTSSTVPIETPGERHIQIAATLSYDPSAPNPIFASTPIPASALKTYPALAIPRPAPRPVIPAAPPLSTTVAQTTTPPPPSPEAKSKRGSVSGFFHKLFGRN